MKRLRSLLLIVLPILMLAPEVEAGIPGGFIQNGFTFRNGVWWGSNGVGYRGYRTCNGWRYTKVAQSYPTASSTYTTSDNSIAVTNVFNNIQQLAPQGASGYVAAPPTLEYSGLDYGAELNGYRRISEQGISGGLSLLSRVVEEDSRVTEYRAKIALLQALNDVTAESPKFQVNIDGNAQVQTGGQEQGGRDGDFQALGGGGAVMQILELRCAACHSGNRIEGELDLSQYPSLSLEDKRLVWKKVRLNDPAKRMPLAPNGGPGEPLSQGELSIIALDLADAALEATGQDDRQNVPEPPQPYEP